jgi:hypothetical protein
VRIKLVQQGKTARGVACLHGCPPGRIQPWHPVGIAGARLGWFQRGASQLEELMFAAYTCYM